MHWCVVVLFVFDVLLVLVEQMVGIPRGYPVMVLLVVEVQSCQCTIGHHSGVSC